MNSKTAFLFHKLMKRGWIDRSEDRSAWEAYLEPDVCDEIDIIGEEIGFDLWRSGDRLYMVPTKDNDLFLKNTIDYRRDIKATNEIRIRDIYLLNYMAIYLLCAFFSGDGAEPRSRDIMTKESFITDFTAHCTFTTDNSSDTPGKEYSENFRRLAGDWLSKLEGNADDLKMNTKYGCLNRLLTKFDKDELFTEDKENNVIRPTRKLADLMPYYLRKDRLSEINSWIMSQEEHSNASDK